MGIDRYNLSDAQLEYLQKAIFEGKLKKTKSGVCPMCGTAFTAKHARVFCKGCSRAAHSLLVTLRTRKRRSLSRNYLHAHNTGLNIDYADASIWTVRTSDGYEYCADPVLGF